MLKAEESPFRPGPGLTPPLRAGHDQAADQLGGWIRAVVNKAGGNIIVIEGPVGGGKTALINEICRSAGGRSLRTRTLTAEAIGAGPAHVEHLLRNGLEAEARGDGKPGVDAREAGPGDSHGGSWGFGIEIALRAIQGRKPLVLTVEDAHLMSPGFGRGLLLSARSIVADDRPFLLLLTGTPGLRTTLVKTRADFWTMSPRLSIGRLESEVAVRQALSVPAETSGMPFDEDALGLAVRESAGHPFFIQLVGDESWKTARSRKGTDRITLQDVLDGAKCATARKDVSFARVCREADQRGTLGAAVAASRAMLACGSKPALNDRQVERALRDASISAGSTPLAMRENLAHIGLIWKWCGGDWEPCIPPLCSFAAEPGQDKATVPGQRSANRTPAAPSRLR